MNDFAREFIAGGVGGVCFTLVFHPCDTVKVMTQTNMQSGGSYSCIKTILKTEGIRGFYRGLLSPLVGVTPMFAFTFLGYDVGNKLQTPSLPNNEYSMSQIYISGMVAGCFSSVILGPFERIKCLVQAQPLESVTNNGQQTGTLSKSKKKYTGAIDCMRKVYKQGGVPSLFKGTLLTFLRDVPSTGFYFLGYEECKKILKVDTSERKLDAMTQMKILIAGGVAGVVNWIVAYPTDVAKSRYQTSAPDEYKNIFQVFRRIVETTGFTTFYKGFGTFIVGCFFAEAACFLGYELAKDIK